MVVVVAQKEACQQLRTITANRARRVLAPLVAAAVDTPLLLGPLLLEVERTLKSTIGLLM
jgi:hypothetical protein